MRSLAKTAEPEVLRDSAAQWLREYLDDPGNGTKRCRYRHPEIKAALKTETSDKCIYCESRIGHNTPGDIEHKVPTARDPTLHFVWTNLSIACTECNRRKNDYYNEYDGFVDPYVDDVEQMLEHNGPVVAARIGVERAEICVNILKLCSPERLSLVAQKILKLNELHNLLERFNATSQGPLREVLRRQLTDMADLKSEYSAMVRSALVSKGYGHLLDE